MAGESSKGDELFAPADAAPLLFEGDVFLGSTGVVGRMALVLPSVLFRVYK
jgi:hypothetical protein